MAGVTLDAGPLILLDRGDRQVTVLLAQAERAGAHVVVPATALAQAIRNPARQARLLRLLRHPLTVVPSLDRSAATRVGRLLAVSATKDVADAHVVVCARQLGTAVVTTDPGDLRQLDPGLEIIPV